MRPLLLLRRVVPLPLPLLLLLRLGDLRGDEVQEATLVLLLLGLAVKREAEPVWNWM